ncbi:uncharacterized protein LOC115416624 [Sphaeramia orbicularis]|uniref:uncharacterized protein LOC115416624 n=1 Tax=Sphaeramia orbicularis TaxID=375764 RepID=UPI00117E3A51|nr:uncharacterized protein LOC115416624 [Sphaeramia orbicularis]
MYHIVEFVDTNEVEVVPSSWVSDGQCLWPERYKLEDIKKATRSMEQPQDTWRSFQIRILYTAANYNIARLKLPQAEAQTDLQTADENEMPKRIKRKRIRNNFLISSDSDNEIPVKKNKLPAAPKIQPPCLTDTPSHRQRTDTPSYRQRTDTPLYRQRTDTPRHWNGHPFTPPENGHPFIPPENGHPSTLSGNGHPFTPPENGHPFIPPENGHPSTLSGNGHPFTPPENGHPFIPPENGHPSTLSGNGHPFTPPENGHPFIPPENGHPFIPPENGHPSTLSGNGHPFTPPENRHPSTLSGNTHPSTLSGNGHPFTPPENRHPSTPSENDTPRHCHGTHTPPHRQRMDTPRHCQGTHTPRHCQGTDTPPHRQRTDNPPHHHERENFQTPSLRDVMSLLLNMNIKIEMLMDQVKVIQQHLATISTTSSPEVEGLLPEGIIPLKDIRALEALEYEIKSKDGLRAKMVTTLSLMGGVDVRETVWRTMRQLMTNSLATNLNWRGVNGKTGFCGLQLKEVINDAVRRNKFTSNATTQEIETFVKRWLQLAGDRDGGRKRRMERGLPDN